MEALPQLVANPAINAAIYRSLPALGEGDREKFIRKSQAGHCDDARILPMFRELLVGTSNSSRPA